MTDLEPLGSDFGVPLDGRPLPSASAPLDARAEAFAGRVYELTSKHGMHQDPAIKRTYREFDRVHHADKHAPGWSEMPFAAEVIAIIIVLIVLAFLIPLLGWVVGEVMVPLWQWAFSWL